MRRGLGRAGLDVLRRADLPAEPSDPARLLTARVDGRVRICVGQNRYSVQPAMPVGGRVAVRVSALGVEVLDGPQVVAVHERAVGKYGELLNLDDYLDVLKYRPGVLPGATALAQARAAGAFTVSHQRYWGAFRHRHDVGGTPALTEILLAQRAVPGSDFRLVTPVSRTGLILPRVGRTGGPPPSPAISAAPLQA